MVASSINRHRIIAWMDSGILRHVVVPTRLVDNALVPATLVRRGNSKLRGNTITRGRLLSKDCFGWEPGREYCCDCWTNIGSNAVSPSCLILYGLQYGDDWVKLAVKHVWKNSVLPRGSGVTGTLPCVSLSLTPRKSCFDQATQLTHSLLTHFS